MKNYLRIFMVILLCLGLSGCGSKEEKKETKEPKETVLTTKEINKKLQDINTWVNIDYWEESLMDMVTFINVGTSASGEELDLDIPLKKYHEEYPKVKDYDSFINSLEDDYTAVKEAWNTMYEQMEKIDTYMEYNGVLASDDPDFSATLFLQAKDIFNTEVQNAIETK